MKQRIELYVLIILSIILFSNLYSRYDDYCSIQAALIMSGINNLPENHGIFLIQKYREYIY